MTKNQIDNETSLALIESIQKWGNVINETSSKDIKKSLTRRLKGHLKMLKKRSYEIQSVENDFVKAFHTHPIEKVVKNNVFKSLELALQIKIFFIYQMEFIEKNLNI